nr:hypothetical protein [uncultured Hyphomonas sp.]
MIDRQNDGNGPAGKTAGTAADPGSFRARLMARKAARPQSTLAIDSGIVYRPGASSTPESRRAADAVRDEARRRRAEAEAAAKADAAARSEAERIRAASAVEVPAPEAKAPPSDEELVSVIEEAAAREEEDRTPSPAMAPAIIPAGAAAVARPDVRPQIAEHEAHEDVSTRTGDVSQLAFAGLAILGLAGLSVLAVQNALKHNDQSGDPATDNTETGTTETGALAPALKPGGASAVALASAAEPAAPKAWFNYQGVADMLAEHKAGMEAEAKLAREAAEKEARLRAAKAIANAEAVRVAEAEAAAAAAAEEARLAEEAERQRLADAEAARVAQEEADRLARLEARREAAAEAEAQRLAELEAKRLAEADAEAQRLADLDTQRLARLRADREAAEAAARQEAFELAKLQEAERLRLAALRAQAEADAAEARRLEQIAAQAAADRLAAEKLVAEQQARTANLQKITAPSPAPEAPAPKPIVFTAYEGPVPVPASHKPAKPARLIRASYTPDEGKTVTRKPPAALTASKAEVRDFAGASGLQTPEAFLAGRIERTSAEPLMTEDMELVRQAFRSILDNGADGSKQAIITPDNRTLTIVLERTVSREMGQSTVRTVTYTPGVSKVTRVVTEQAPVTVSVMCRDVAYAFAGQERGRFAACQAPDGGWTLARATDVVKVTTASLPNSAS